MIRKSKRINVRFTEQEMTEMRELMKLAMQYDITAFVRAAVASYRRFLYTEQARRQEEQRKMQEEHEAEQKRSRDIADKLMQKSKKRRKAS